MNQIAAPSAPLQDLFGIVEVPVVAAYGAGLDSTAMLVEMVEAGERVDHVLFADTGAEKPETYAYLKLFTAWLAERGIPLTVVYATTKKFQNYPSYSGLLDACLVNGVLPALAYGGASCSMRWKVKPQIAWIEEWEPARRVWAAGGKVIQLIGFDAGPADSKRHAAREGYEDDRFEIRYPLRELGWDREACAARIHRAGLPPVPKSACVFCPSCKPKELHEMGKEELRQIVLVELRAKPRLKNMDGLWRKPVKGMRGATPKPGSMTEYIEQQGLLPASDVDAIRAAVPTELVAWETDWTGDEGSMPGREAWAGVLKLRDAGFFGSPDRMFRGIPVVTA